MRLTRLLLVHASVVFLMEVLLKRKTFRVIRFFVLFLILAVAFIIISRIATWLLTFVPSSRTLQLLATDSFYLSGRNIYYSALIDEIIKSKYAVHGLYSDRFFMAPIIGKTELKEIYGMYSHNFVIEVLFQMGWLGVPFLLVFLFI